MKYAVTASTGRFGKYAISELEKIINQEDTIVAIARDVEKAKKVLPKNIEIREGNYDSSESITDALKGIDRVLFISSQPGGKVSRQVQHQNVVSSLEKNNVKFVAYTSFPNAQKSKSELAQDHKKTEDMIMTSDMNYSFLRNNWYLENESSFIQNGVANKNVKYWAENKAGWALEREYAEAAAKVLVLDKPKKIYEFTGKLASFNDLGLALKQATGNDFSIDKLTNKEYVKYLEDTGLDNDTAELVASFQLPINNGSLDFASNDLEVVLNREPKNLLASIEELIK